ncbi:hypothetical protein FSP39_002553, partial [Pinctada imbricata]
YCGRSADVAFLVDASSSIWEPYFKIQMKFVERLVKMFDVSSSKTRIALVTFSEKLKVEFYLNELNTSDDMVRVIRTLPFARGMQTKTFDALKFLRTNIFKEENGDRPYSPNVAIIFTDGRSDDVGKTIQEAEIDKRSKIYLFAIGIGRLIDVFELMHIASRPLTDFLFRVQSFKEFRRRNIRHLLSFRAC